jgi:ABC-2 type transport system ATP-binding protein
METAVNIQNVSIHIGQFKILHNITIPIQEGKITGLLGPSGAGKTTLMRAIVGRQKIHSGKISVFGLPASSASLRTEIGYVTQAPSVYPDLTVRENMRYFAALTGASKARIGQVIEDVDLGSQHEQLVGTLSGGQKSRVSLAVALLAQPQLLVLDEPTVGVDPLLRRELWNQFHRLAAEGITLIVSSHVMDEASQCDRLVLLRDGGLLAEDSLSELYKKTDSNNVEDVFIKLIGANQ